jgi:hypothetical protein
LIDFSAGGHGAVNHNLNDGTRLAAAAQRQQTRGERRIQKAFVERGRANRHGRHAYGQRQPLGRGHHITRQIDKLQAEDGVARLVNGGGGGPDAIRCDAGRSKQPAALVAHADAVAAHAFTAQCDLARRHRRAGQR